MIGIYKITNKLNNKAYIGQSVHCGKRLDEHCKGNQFIDDIIKLEGIENFNFEILKEVNKSELNFWEDYYIIKYKTMFPDGYNKRWNCSEDLRKILSNSINTDIINVVNKEEDKKENEQTHINDEWKSIILTKEDYDILKEINKYSSYRELYMVKDNWIGTKDRYKKYLYNKMLAAKNRKKIINMPHLIRSRELKFTDSDIKFCWFIEDLIKEYNSGVSTWNLDSSGFLRKIKETQYQYQYNYEFAEDRIILYPKRRGIFKYKTFNKLRVEKGMDLSNFKFFCGEEEKELDYLIENKITHVDRTEILGEN